jgi:hypothetical protein
MRNYPILHQDKLKQMNCFNAVLHIMVTGEFSIMISRVPLNESEQPLDVG